MKKVLFLMKIKESHSDNYSPAIFNWYGILEKLGYEVYYEDYTNYNSEEFYKLVKSHKPDYIFHPTYEGFHAEFIKLREFSKVYCIHSDDDWRFNDYARHWIPFTDGAIGYQNTQTAYVEQGAANSYYSRARWAFNPNMMHYEFTSNKTYGISHLGGLHGNKAQSMQRLNSAGLSIDLIDPKFTSYTQYLEAYHQSTISICLTSNSAGSSAQSKTRLAEIPYYCILASEPWPNFMEIVNKVLVDKDFAQQMYKSGKDILIKHNTVFHEWNRIMQNIDEDYKPVDVSSIIDTYNL